MSEKLQWVSPLPPLRTGIANYSADLFDAVDGVWNVDAIGEPGSQLRPYATISALPRDELDDQIPTIIHLGNSEFHDVGFAAAASIPAIVVLHDVFLHHARAAMALRTGRTRQYWRELQDEYGESGVAAGRAVFAGRDFEDLDKYPMVERYVRSARAVVVHNRSAAERVKALAPDTPVYVVPMGLPIPAVVDKQNARRAMRLGQSDFIVGSITHVNPNKRLHIVLRAVRRLVAERPDTRLILAGTGSDGDLLTREIEILGLRQHVIQFGYVDDRTARILASTFDACVNLRYPTAGETSASLLRLLGAGLPVAISDAGSSAELPDGVGLKIPVGETEIDMLVAVLRALARDSSFRDDAGNAAREFVIEQHSMVSMIDGYRRAIADVYGIELPGISAVPHEAELAVDLDVDMAQTASSGVVIAAHVANDLGLESDPAALETLGQALVDLGLDNTRAMPAREPSVRVRQRVLCPRCAGTLSEALTCTQCGHTVELRRGALDIR